MPSSATAIVLFLVLLFATACSKPPPVQSLAGTAMGTTWSIKLVAPADTLPALRTEVENELALLVRQMSTWEAESELSRFNRAATGTWQTLPEPLYDVLAFALQLADDTGGAYDPTVGPLVNLWGFGPDGAPRTAPPAADDITAAQARIGWRRIELDPDTRRARQPGGIFIDVSSLGPGYAVDRIAARLRDAGVTQFLVELGGEMRAAGRKPDGSAWRVAVERPDVTAGAAPDLVVMLDDLAAGSSGDYRVGFEHDGVRYSHTIDPRTGAPVRHALAAVTVLAPTAMEADATAAALMVLGPDAGWTFARNRGLAAAFTLRDGNGYLRRLTPAFEARREP